MPSVPDWVTLYDVERAREEPNKCGWSIRNYESLEQPKPELSRDILILLQEDEKEKFLEEVPKATLMPVTVVKDTHLPCP